MAFATVAEAEARISELEQENKTLVKGEMTHRKGYKQLKDFLESKGFDVSGNLEDQWESTAGKSKTELDTLSAKIDRMSKQLEKAEQEKTELKAQQEESTIKTELSGKMKDIVGNDDLIDLWLAKKKIKLVDGKPVYVDGEREVPIEKHIESYKKSNPDRVRVQQKDGGASHKSSNDSQNVKKLSIGEFDKLTRKEQDAFMMEGGEVT